MLSWIFRRAPLLARAYGPAARPGLAGARFAAPSAPLLAAGPPPPGGVARRAGQVELRAMPPRAAGGDVGARRAG